MSTFSISPAVKKYDIPVSELRFLHPGKRLVVGVAIFRLVASASHMSSMKKELLLLQRASHEDTFPDMYEIPGGHVEDTDDTVLATVFRETFEETGLVVDRVVREFDGFEYPSRNGPTVQLNFIVEVHDGGNVTLNPEEHQAFAWVEPGANLGLYALTGNMVKVVQDALEISVQT
ncbi:hypothetical protein SERLA73DRAFT_177778 [Serpula lacrymans var. lacrymans S7.3]|uniref:Nudix hydrolase domain-containing protein n=2 Tax=Serpula lacrymans var. lacrymans TaxID=341189 RepID=F8PPI3_SERL3|nr:uncharacterized protein SERLADRAFT_461558 [Serpula lacrymans var. lacrymans S7.9]EGO02060.1 hypothetical protein SERLA73DRAFT_177778 [Serpula lacrymans var. lacrymans S7.3]EGO27682.1 hypothetical protein SERLADRAFT_461558 [Serpula lacrymans var. lacrymans S7.9]